MKHIECSVSSLTLSKVYFKSDNFINTKLFFELHNIQNQLWTALLKSSVHLSLNILSNMLKIYKTNYSTLILQMYFFRLKWGVFLYMFLQRYYLAIVLFFMKIM